MSEIKDGGPAFPYVWVDTGHDGEIAHGMSIRDYFAAKALAGGLCFHQEDGCPRDEKEAANMAYAFADAMLEARK